MATMAAMVQLPVIGSEGAERADAARNRARILSAAERLFAERGASCVSMDEVACAAGVGKGTLFRRFGSRAALARAVLSERESAFQEAIIRGEPPLGPGAPPLERLVAFGVSVLDLLAGHADLVVAAEGGGARFASAPYAVYRLHITLLLRQANRECDAEYLAEALLACLGADFFLYLRDGREMELQRLKAGWEELVRSVLGPWEAAAGATGGGPDEAVATATATAAEAGEAADAPRATAAEVGRAVGADTSA
jgi:AcrR family transcriptional regulator